MKQTDYRENPIDLKILPHTGKKDGDDSKGEKSPGYRNVPISPEDERNPDPMRIVKQSGIECIPIYSVGRTPGLCEYYDDGGIGGPKDIIVRQPVLHGLERVNHELARFNRRLVVVDGFRPYTVQVSLWKYLRAEVLRAKNVPEHEELTVTDEVAIGLKADDIGSYCAAVENEEFSRRVELFMRGPKAGEIEEAAKRLEKTPQEIAVLYLTFRANLGKEPIELAKDAVTAHGNGGAVDVYMRNMETNRFANLGVPFDYVPRPSASRSLVEMNAFESISIVELAEEIWRDTVLQRYYTALGVDIDNIDVDLVEDIQRERRLLYGVMTDVAAATIYVGEPWHFNLGNRQGGYQAKRYPNAGNGCHSLLKNIQDEKGSLVAVWGNKTGHKLAREMRVW